MKGPSLKTFYCQSCVLSTLVHAPPKITFFLFHQPQNHFSFPNPQTKNSSYSALKLPPSSHVLSSRSIKNSSLSQSCDQKVCRSRDLENGVLVSEVADQAKHWLSSSGRVAAAVPLLDSGWSSGSSLLKWRIPVNGGKGGWSHDSGNSSPSERSCSLECCLIKMWVQTPMLFEEFSSSTDMYKITSKKATMWSSQKIHLKCCMIILFNQSSLVLAFERKC